MHSHENQCQDVAIKPAQWKDKATGTYSRRVKARTAAFLVPRNTTVGLKYTVIFVLIFSHFPQ